MSKPTLSHDAYRTDSQGRKTNRWRVTHGIASEFIHHLLVLREQVGLVPIVLMCRVSSKKQQNWRRTLDHQVSVAVEFLTGLGYRVGVDLFVLCDQEVSDIRGERPLLVEAIAFAKSLGAILVAMSRDRFLRWTGAGRGCRKETEPPTIVEYLLLKDMAGNVPLATIEPPDDPAARSRQIKRGQKAKGRKGGRPPKAKTTSKKGQTRRECKKRKTALLELAREMQREGMSCQKIADALNGRETGFDKVNKMTVYRWLKKP